MITPPPPPSSPALQSMLRHVAFKVLQSRKCFLVCLLVYLDPLAPPLHADPTTTLPLHHHTSQLLVAFLMCSVLEASNFGRGCRYTSETPCPCHRHCCCEQDPPPRRPQPNLEPGTAASTLTSALVCPSSSISQHRTFYPNDTSLRLTRGVVFIMCSSNNPSDKYGKTLGLPRKNLRRQLRQNLAKHICLYQLVLTSDRFAMQTRTNDLTRVSWSIKFLLPPFVIGFPFRSPFCSFEFLVVFIPAQTDSEESKLHVCGSKIKNHVAFLQGICVQWTPPTLLSAESVGLPMVLLQNMTIDLFSTKTTSKKSSHFVWRFVQGGLCPGENLNIKPGVSQEIVHCTTGWTKHVIPWKMTACSW